jgi:hypothetical protein
VIPRYQRILYWTLAASSLLMAIFLMHGCEQAHRRLAALVDSTPISAPTDTPVDVTLYLASDLDGSITPTPRQLALPQDSTLRARALIEQLLAEYALPNSGHPLPSGTTIDDVFLLTPPANDSDSPSSPSAKLAVINLHGAFLDQHPSGVLVEDLTLFSIIGTLHANLPEVTEVRFLADGKPRETLNGHADLSRTYPATDTAYQPHPPTEEATK